MPALIGWPSSGTPACVRRLSILLALPLCACGGSRATPANPKAERQAALAAPAEAASLTYPPAVRGDTVDEVHGVEVADPYRWLEDPQAEDSRAWIEAQNELTFGFLERIPARESLKKRLTEVWNFERFGIPHKKGGRYFYSKNDGLQDQAILYWTPALDQQAKVLLDPNALSHDGTIALSGFSISEDGRYVAYGLQSGGSDWQVWRVREVATGEDLADEIQWVKFSSAAWSHDGKGFYYSRYPEPKTEKELTGENFHHKVYYHRLNDAQDQDELVFEKPDEKKWGFGARVTDDGRFLVVAVWKGTGNQNLLYVQDLTKKQELRLARPEASFTGLVTEWKGDFSFVANEGTRFWIATDLEAPRRKLIQVDVENPDPKHWRTIIPEDEATLQGVSRVCDRLLASYLDDARSRVRVHDLDGAPLGDVALPGIGSAGGFEGRRGDPETFYAFSAYTEPTTIYRYDVEAGESTVFRKPTVDFDGSHYETRQVFYRSRDGTKVPMFIVHRKGIELDGSHPTYLYGYGGFNISLTPGFSITQAMWLEMGGVLAVANLRGGGEYGEAWHQQGIKLSKQKVFDDFIAAAEYLIEERFTSPRKLAISGRSNGGLLVGAAMTQRPELFGAALPAVGVLDMLRFHKFTIGWAWVDDYGSPDDAKEFQALLAYSPYHAVRVGTSYPPTLITTADHDDRVVPAHSFKFAAALQHAHEGPNPVLIRIETRAGHGAGTPTAMQIDEAADVLAFLVEVLDIPWPKP
jgi:prolyl oligopeptidase